MYTVFNRSYLVIASVITSPCCTVSSIWISWTRPLLNLTFNSDFHAVADSGLWLRPLLLLFLLFYVLQSLCCFLQERCFPVNELYFIMYHSLFPGICSVCRHAGDWVDVWSRDVMSGSRKPHSINESLLTTTTKCSEEDNRSSQNRETNNLYKLFKQIQI